jgi:hypothetical protein
MTLPICPYCDEILQSLRQKRLVVDALETLWTCLNSNCPLFNRKARLGDLGSLRGAQN